MKNARSLKENGVAVGVIAKSLGLTEEEMEKLCPRQSLSHFRPAPMTPHPEVPHLASRSATSGIPKCHIQEGESATLRFSKWHFRVVNQPYPCCRSALPTLPFSLTQRVVQPSSRSYSLFTVHYSLFLGCFLADDDVAAVGALPDDVVVLREDTLLADVVEQTAIALFVLNSCGTEWLRQHSRCLKFHKILATAFRFSYYIIIFAAKLACAGITSVCEDRSQRKHRCRRQEPLR